MKKIARYVFNTIFILFVGAVLALGVAVLALQFPFVQTRLVREATESLSQKLGFPTSVGRVNIKWFDALSLQNVQVLDREGRPMIQIELLDLNHDFWSVMMRKDTTIRGMKLDEVTLFRPSIWLVKNPKNGDLNLDEFIAKITELTSNLNDSTSIPNQNVPFKIADIHIVDATLRWQDSRQPPIRGRAFDYNNFTLKNLNAEGRDFYVLGDSIGLNIKNLRTFDKATGLSVNELDTKFLYCNTKIELADLYGKIGNSVIKNYLSLNYNAPADLGDFNNKVIIKARLDSSRVRSEDAGWFAESLFKLKETWRVNGDFDGTVNDFKLTNSDVAFGKNSRLWGNLAFKDVTDFNKMRLGLDLQNARIAATDLHQYYPEKSFVELTQKFGVVDFSGKYAGTIQKFQLSGDFKTALGNVLVRDLTMNLAAKVPTYVADIKTTGFDLGKAIGDPDFQQIDLDGKISGSGFSIKDAALDLNSRLARFTYNNYEYRNVFLRGNLQKKLFEGFVSVRDSNLLAQVDGLFDLSGPKYIFHARGKIERADLRALHFMKDSLKLHTDLDVDLVGNTPDELVGQAKFLNSYFSLGKRNLVIDTLLFDSQLAQTERQLKINSEFFAFQAKGPFKPTVAVADLSRLLGEYELYFFGDEAARASYYDLKQRSKLVLNQRYSVDYNVQFKRMAPLLAFLYPEGYVSPNSTAEGVFTVDNTSIFSFAGQFDTLKIGKNTFYQSEIDLNSSKFTNSPEVLAAVIINSQKQQFSGIAPTEKLNLEATWERDHINFLSRIRQQNASNRAALDGELRFIGDAIQIQFEKSKLQLLDAEWKVAANNLITITGSDVTFSNLMLSSKDQLIALNGDLSKDSTRTLAFETQNFELATLNPVLNTSLSGTLNGSANLRDLYRNVIFDSKMRVNKLGYNQFVLGDLTGSGDWDPVDKHLHVDVHLDKDNRRPLSITGVYEPTKIGKELDLKAIFNEADLKLLAPFTAGLVSDLSGQSSGIVIIKGTPTAPVLNGTVAVKRGRLTFDYLKAVFSFEDSVYFGASDVVVKKMRLTDPEGNVATLSGGVYHNDFANFTLGFDANLRNFKMLNTSIRDNERFYGTAYATGKMEVFGGIDNLNVKANLTSNRNTKIYIPLDGAAEVASEDFVQFVSAQPDTSAATLLKNKNQRSAGDKGSLKLDLALNITPDAYCEIKFDRQTDEAIKAYGKGLINLKIDTRGDFAMSGTYEIQSGDYMFTLQNGVLKKRFTIQPGGRITWAGDPYTAMLDVKASYVQNTSLGPLISTGLNASSASTAAKNDALTRRYPVEVTIALTDRLLAPQIGYDLKIKEYPLNYQFEVSAAETRLKRDEQFLSRQVSSLLLFGQLFPDNADIVAQGNASSNNSVGGLVSNTASELITNQISKWASSVSDKLEVGVSGLALTGFNFSDPNAINNLQLRFSYRFLNDRFRITRDGRLSYGQNQYDASSLLLDWTLEYWITEDGSQRLKMYNRNLQNQFSAATNAVSYGASYLFTRSFNNFQIFGLKTQPPPPTDAGRLTSKLVEIPQ